MITSIQNSQVKNWKKLHTRKFRAQMQQFLIEGDHLIEAAKESGWRIKTIILLEGKAMPAWCTSSQLVIVNRPVFNEITQTESPQGIIAVVEMQQTVPVYDGNLLLIDAVQDPGNLGTMIRTADAAGFAAVFLGAGTVDVYNEKVIRASQGSLFHIPIIPQAALATVIPELKNQGHTISASALANATLVNDALFSAKNALIVGNEGAGVNEQLLQMADQIVKIPIYGKAESLNVSIAAGILMYQMRK